MTAARIRAREHLQILKLPVIMQLQDQPLPQPPNTIHNVAPVLFQHAPPLTLDYLQTCASGTPAAQTPPCSPFQR